MPGGACRWRAHHVLPSDRTEVPVRVVLLPALCVPGCLLGSDPLGGAANVPALDGEDAITLVTPLPSEGGTWARVAQEVVVDVRTEAPIAVAGDNATRVTLDGFPMTFVEEVDTHTWRYRRVLTGEEGSSPKTVSGVLSAAFGEGRTVFSSEVLLTTDFIPPSGACVLAPTQADADAVVTLTVTPSEALAGGVATVTPSDPRLEIGAPARVGNQLVYAITAPASTNLDGYTLAVTGTDLAGNPQEGDTLCPEASSTGSILGVGPQLAGDVIVQVTPGRLTVDGATSWVRTDDGAPTTITITLPTVDPILPEASTVQLGGLSLTPVAAPANTWTRTLDGTEGDGPKRLEAWLVDAAGNRLDVQRSALLRFDFTPPVADCVLAPPVARADDAVTLQVFVSEPLQGGAPEVTADDAALTVASPSSQGNAHSFALGLATPVDLPSYTLTVTGRDRAGNAQEGASLCAEINRTGTWFGVRPSLDGPVTLTATPSVADPLGPKVGVGAEVEVHLPTAAALDVVASRVTLSGIPLVWLGNDRWGRVLDGSEGDGLKALDATLVDAAGNETRVRSDTLPAPVQLVADFTPPTAAVGILARSPFFAPALASDGSVVRFAERDPFSDLPVSATLTVFASERLSGTVELTVDGPGPLTLDGGVPSRNVVSWSKDGLTDVAEGTYTFSVTLTDEVGNRSTPQPLDVVMVMDRTPPADPPDTLTPGLVHAERTPWGSVATGGSPRLEVTGGPGAAEPFATVLLYVGTGIVGNTRAGADGSFSGLRSPTDSATLLLGQADDAGNASTARAQVLDTTWTASLGFKEAGDTRVNPHVFESVPRFDPMREAFGASEPAVLPDLGATSTRFVSGGRPVWRAAATGDLPAPRVGTATVTDPARGVVVLFGGFPLGGAGVDDGTWVWNGHAWSVLNPPGATPTSRFNASMAWDAVRQDVLMFGGTDYATTYDETWTWDGGRWTRQSPSLSPPARQSAGMAGHVSAGLVVLAGGTTGFTPLADTWVWDGEQWDEAAGDPLPGPRQGMAMAWDPASEQVVLFGGTDGTTTYGDTWVFDATLGWQPLDVTGPPARHTSAMAWDASRGGLVLAHGFDGSRTQLADAWLWDGAGWTELSDLGGPPALAEHSLLADPVHGDVFLFGGRSAGNTPLAAPWRLGPDGWVSADPRVRPSARNGAALGWDAAREELILFGGEDLNIQGARETWRWDGRGWSQAAPATSPPGRVVAQLAWDDAAEELLLVGGRASASSAPLADVWAWNGVDWDDRTPVAGPPPREFHALTARGGGLVLYGGQDASRTIDLRVWTLDGRGWTPRPVSPTVDPGGRIQHGFAWHPSGRHAVLFGGSNDTTANAETWTWDDRGWQALGTLSPTPVYRRLASLTTDAARDRVWMFGGETNDAVVDELWAWNGSAWERQTPIGEGPGARTVGNGAVDTRRGELMVFGLSGLASGDDTFLLDTGALARPAHRLVVDVGAAEAFDASLSSLTVDWTAGATGFPDGQPRHGAALVVWDGEAWRTVATNTASGASPTRLCWSVVAAADVVSDATCARTVDATLLGRVIVGVDAPALHAAVVAQNPIGSGSTTSPWGTVVSQGGLQVTVSYRLPEP